MHVAARAGVQDVVTAVYRVFHDDSVPGPGDEWREEGVEFPAEEWEYDEDMRKAGEHVAGMLFLLTENAAGLSAAAEARAAGYEDVAVWLDTVVARLDPDNERAEEEGRKWMEGVLKRELCNSVDGDVYIPGGNGREWYINQSNFYRQIRNLVFDMRGMAWSNYQGDQKYYPTGIHWQVGQATSITNCDFKMDVSTSSQSATAIGIAMENGSGGSVADLTFFGGNYGFVAGSQQFTATNLQFTSCLTAIQQIWNWGFTWKNIYVLSCYVAIDCTMYSTVTSQGTGSITVLDSHFNGVPYAITVQRLGSEQLNIMLENLLVENSQAVVLVSGGETILPGSSGSLYFNSWASGYQYLPGGGGGKVNGFINPATRKPQSLLDGNGRYFVRPKPQYESIAAGSIVVATDNGVSISTTADQTSAINKLLLSKVESVIFFPAGIYLVQGTVVIPVGSKIVGSAWSQIMGSGTFFKDIDNPKVMVQVGNNGDRGVVEISDMLFTVQGPAAGCILMEWNVHESSQGSASMWDSHFRLGGATGSNLQLADCAAPVTRVMSKCEAAYMVMHMTNGSSGYFDNVWPWVPDHDLDNTKNGEAYESPEGIPLSVGTQISIYVGRGLLIESQGPTWLYGTASEHAQMYQYQLNGASNIYLGHMQTETPYYQPNPNALSPYKAGTLFSGDLTFPDCSDDSCRGAWALRIVNSSNIVIYSAGFYSFFQNNQLGCTTTEHCHFGLIETSFSQGVWIYNIFTKGNIQIVSPKGGLMPVLFNDTTRNGYTSEIAAWLALAIGGGNLGIGPNGTGGSNDVYVDPGIWRTPSSLATMKCTPPCTFILPPITLPTPTTISFPPSTTSLEVGWSTTTTYVGDYDGQTTTTIVYVTVTVTTTLTPPPYTGSIIPVSNVPIPSGITSTVVCAQWSLEPPPFVMTDDRDPEHAGTQHPINTRTITPKPYPWHTYPNRTSVATQSSTPGECLPFTFKATTGPPAPICTGGCGHKCSRSEFCSWPCPSGCDADHGCDGDTNDCPPPVGADCAGPHCTRGGDCTGLRCSRGGDCTGPKCTAGGSCQGFGCERGGSCFGIKCVHGGGCVGPVCHHGGGCGPFACPPGGCTGPECGFEDSDSSFCDSNDPDCDPGQEDEECTTTTWDQCLTLCFSSTPTPTCSTTCSDVQGCDTTGTMWASTITPAPGFVMELGDDWLSETDYVALVNQAHSIITFLSSKGELNLTSHAPSSVSRTSSTTSAVKTTSTSTRPQSTGLVVAAYTVCQIGPVGVCEYQWELYGVTTGNPGNFPGCSTDGALYSSVVTAAPDPSHIPRLGPFSIDGKSNCYFEQGKGLTCVTAAGKSYLHCFPDGNAICVGDGVKCNAGGTEGYNADVYVFW